MYCINHPDSPAQGMCTKCGKIHCSECLVDVQGIYQCRKCLKNSSIPSPPVNAYRDNSNSNSYQSINTVNNDTGKIVLWILLMFFFPYAGIFIDKAKPFGPTGNLICKIIGWIFTITFLFSFFAYIFLFAGMAMY